MLPPIEQLIKLRLERDCAALVEVCRSYYQSKQASRNDTDEFVRTRLPPEPPSAAEPVILELIAAFDAAPTDRARLIAGEDLADAVVRYAVSGDIRDRTPPTDQVESFYDMGSFHPRVCDRCDRRRGFFPIDGQDLCAHCAFPTGVSNNPGGTMEPEEIIAKVKAIMAEMLERDVADFDDDATFKALEIGSIDRANLAETIDEEFGVVFDDEEMYSFDTIGGFCRSVAARVNS